MCVNQRRWPRAEAASDSFRAEAIERLSIVLDKTANKLPRARQFPGGVEAKFIFPETSNGRDEKRAPVFAYPHGDPFLQGYPLSQLFLSFYSIFLQP